MTIGLFSGLVKLLGGSDGTVIGNEGDRLKVKCDTTVDVVTGNMVVIDTVHHEVHEGESYTHKDIHTVGNGQTYYFMAVTPNTAKRIHLRYSISTTAQGKLAIFEGPTTTANGTGAVIFNRDRNSSNTPSLALYHAPTVTAEGTLFEEDSFGAGGGNKQGRSEVDVEWILKQNTKYLFKLTSQASNNDFVVSLFWYEEG